jgi:zinc-ribbon domain
LDIIAILVGLIIFAAIAFYVGRPLLPSRRRADSGGDTLSLEAQRESLYTQIKELDLDHATGKVNDDDYVRLRADIVAEAVTVLKQIDGVAQEPAASTGAAPAGKDDVEALIAARRKTRSAPAATTSAVPKAADSDVEAAIAARRKSAAPVVSELKCPQCGKPITADDAFCAKCGAALRAQPTA